MTIEHHKGDLLAANAEALVNTVNCVGVMGKGVALQFKRAFPDNFKAYCPVVSAPRKACLTERAACTAQDSSMPTESC